LPCEEINPQKRFDGSFICQEIEIHNDGDAIVEGYNATEFRSPWEKINLKFNIKDQRNYS